MGGYDPNFDDVSNFLNFPTDSDDEDDGGMTPEPGQNQDMDQDVKPLAAPPSPPQSSTGSDNNHDLEAIDEDDYDDDDLYGPSNDTIWKDSQDSSSLASPVNPQWLLSSEPPRTNNALSESSRLNHPSPPTSDDAKTPSDRRSAVDSIQERNEQLIKTGTNAKTSKSFPLLPDLLSLKQAEDEDEKILASEVGKRLNPRERRQLRNKVSARNFRVRRKGMCLRKRTLIAQNILVI
jgi:hypothetical protein